MNILFLDDDSDIVSVLKDYFSNSGFNVFAATNIESFVALSDEFDFDLIVSDYNLGKNQSAQDLFQIIKKNSSPFRTIPILIFSSETEVLLQKVVDSEKKMNIQYVRKPEFEKLSAIVNQLARK